MPKNNNYIIVVICTLNLLYNLFNPNDNRALFILGFVIPYLIIRKGQTYKSFKKVYNVDGWKLEFKSFWNIVEILLTVEVYFCTVQFENGILNGLTTEFSNNMIFSVIPCLLMYRFVIYRSLELSY